MSRTPMTDALLQRQIDELITHGGGSMEILQHAEERAGLARSLEESRADIISGAVEVLRLISNYSAACPAILTARAEILKDKLSRAREFDRKHGGGE